MLAGIDRERLNKDPPTPSPLTPDLENSSMVKMFSPMCIRDQSDASDQAKSDQKEMIKPPQPPPPPMSQRTSIKTISIGEESVVTPTPLSPISPNAHGSLSRPMSMRKVPPPPIDSDDEPVPPIDDPPVDSPKKTLTRRRSISGSLAQAAKFAAVKREKTSSID